MSDYSELKRLADRVISDRRFCGDENHKALADGVAALIAENERLTAKIEQVRSRSVSLDCSPDGVIPNAMDAWGRAVPQHLPYDFSGNPGASATQYCNGWNDAGGYWKAHCVDIQSERDQLKAVNFDLNIGRQAADEEIVRLKSENAGLKTGYEAYEQVVQGLKAEVEALRKSAPSKEVIWCACGDGHAANSYGAGFMDANDGVCANCDAAMSKGEQS